ncbi:hypothetical protein KR059_005777, partial [Drosophila kikkawai]
EYAVTLRTKIQFMDSSWQTIATAAHEFDELSALTFDETEELIYFNDLKHKNGSIFSLRRDALAASHVAEQAIKRTGNESVGGLAYDPLNRNLFWSDTQQRKIFFASIDSEVGETPKVLVDLSQEGGRPDGVAVDVCRRKLYWTNSNITHPSVERIDLDGSNRTVIISTNIDMPKGIVVDQLSDRLFWIDDLKGVFFAVESSRMDGSDRQVVLKDKHHEPLNLAVTNDAIYWTDRTTKAVWSHPKVPPVKVTTTAKPVEMEDTTDPSESKPESDPEPVPEECPLVRVANLSEEARGIVARTGFYQRLQKDAHCASIVRKVKQRLDEKSRKQSSSLLDEKIAQLERDHCMNGGSYIPNSDLCICPPGFKGSRCEIRECHNYCVHGTCQMSEQAYPKCYCQPGFSGERCEVSKCSGLCLNGGHCRLVGENEEQEPSCECPPRFGGARCEQNSTEICSLFCRLLKHEPVIYVPFGCHSICEELAQENSTNIAIPQYQHLEVCLTPNVWTSSVIIILVVGIVLSLLLVAIIVHGVRRLYKPKRPRIRKTFVVRKQARTNSAGDTPLTNRPLATEQCEITIENCCNMNICETPCFDPKLVEQTLAKSSCKEDKKILIHNMEDDLY